MWIDSKKTIIALAPMADFTDLPFCKLCREVAGENFVIFREMVSAEAIVRGSEKTLGMCRVDPVERPVVLQLFGSDSEVIVEAAKILVGKGSPGGACPERSRRDRDDIVCDGIDINMGCPVPKIAKKGKAGASLMKDQDRAVEIVKALKKADLGVPVSVKTRLGWAKDDEILEFAPKLEKAGADLITIHGRTKKQGYSGVANWDRIAEVKKLVNIPVIANGDVGNEEDIEKCLKITGADGVMIGRGALGNPWIFSPQVPPPIRGRLGGGYTSESIPPHISSNDGGSELKKIVLRHAQLHLDHYGEDKGLVTFRKHLLFYFKGFEGVKELRQKLVKVESRADLEKILAKL